jgi:hypothetical protein
LTIEINDCISDIAVAKWISFCFKVSEGQTEISGSEDTSSVVINATNEDERIECICINFVASDVGVVD